MEQKQEAREYAEQNYQKYQVADEDMTPVIRAMVAAYSAGWNARDSAWRKIESEADLPQEDGRYLVWSRKPPSRYSPDTMLFLADDPIYVEGWVHDYAAWMPIPPFEGGSDER